MKIKDMVYAALFAAIVAILGLVPPISLGFIPVPITLQTLGVMLTGSFLGKKTGTLSSFLIIVVVILGLPILSGGRGGLSVLVGPTGGFFLSWPIATFIIGFFTEKFWSRINIWKYLIFNFIGGVLVINAIGAPYMAFITKIPVTAAFVSCAAFIPGDLVKAAIASVVCVQMKALSPINGGISMETGYIPGKQR